MCSITTPRRTPQRATGPLSKIKKDIPLQTYFNRAYKDALLKHQLGDQPADDSTAKLHVPMTLIAYDKSGLQVHSRAGIYQDEMHFSASLLKAGVMYAAYKLLKEAEDLAKSPPAGGFSNQNAFFAALQKQFNSSDAVPEITKVGADAGLVPRYADILKVDGFGGELNVTFVPEFFRSVPEDRDLYAKYVQIRHDQGLKKNVESPESRAALARVSHMYKMIVWSNNTSAGECIRRLGYAYINVKLMGEGLFDKEHTKGIWIGGDYVGVAPRIEVDSVNDDKVATATTTKHMAELFSLIKLEKLPHSDKMQLLISEAQQSEPSFISRAPGRLFAVGGVKIGVANIKPNTKPLGPDVSSEGIIFEWKTRPGEKLPKDRNLNGIFAACWQNVRGDAIAADKPAHNVRTIADTETEWDGVAEVIQNTIKNFINQTALP
jgi:hypothetical protein